MILFHKTIDEISRETLEALEAAGIKNSSPGDMVRIMLAVMNDRLGKYYESLELNHMQAFVSRAAGIRLEAIGEMVNCKRRASEDDESYRYRITRQILSVATANETAVRLAALSVAGVQDVLIKPMTHGSGSFSIYVIDENAQTSEEVLDLVRSAVEEVKALGIRSTVMRPIVKEIEISIRITLPKNYDEFTRTYIESSVRRLVDERLNSSTIGQVLDTDDIKRDIVESIPDLVDIQIYNLKVDGRETLPGILQPRWNERFVESGKQNAIRVT